ncbi:MAG: hypothetical protein AAF389_14060 [Gemmatimonadota bacterium]
MRTERVGAVRVGTIVAIAVASSASILGAQDPYADPMLIPAIQDFVAEGFGAVHDDAPPQTLDFGRLVGLWKTETTVQASDGSWVPQGEGLWAWKYDLGGFAVRDLWFSSEAALPPYMASLGRDYLLSSIRIFDRASSGWKVAWVANGGGTLPGQDFGTFEARDDDGSIVMMAPPQPGFGVQRVVFDEITDGSFRWSSEVSRDSGTTWITMMRVHARRVERAPG